jgi:hypothetical protein
VECFVRSVEIESGKARFSNAACPTVAVNGLSPVTTPDANEKYHDRPDVESGGGRLAGTAADGMRLLLMIANGGTWAGNRPLSPESIARKTPNRRTP